jgi:hypothetical protein
MRGTGAPVVDVGIGEPGDVTDVALGESGGPALHGALVEAVTSFRRRAQPAARARQATP